MDTGNADARDVQRIKARIRKFLLRTWRVLPTLWTFTQAGCEDVRADADFIFTEGHEWIEGILLCLLLVQAHCSPDPAEEDNPYYVDSYYVEDFELLLEELENAELFLTAVSYRRILRSIVAEGKELVEQLCQLTSLSEEIPTEHLLDQRCPLRKALLNLLKADTLIARRLASEPRTQVHKRFMRTSEGKLLKIQVGSVREPSALYGSGLLPVMVTLACPGMNVAADDFRDLVDVCWYLLRREGSLESPNQVIINGLDQIRRWCRKQQNQLRGAEQLIVAPLENWEAGVREDLVAVLQEAVSLLLSELDDHDELEHQPQNGLRTDRWSYQALSLQPSYRQLIVYGVLSNLCSAMLLLSSPAGLALDSLKDYIRAFRLVIAAMLHLAYLHTFRCDVDRELLEQYRQLQEECIWLARKARNTYFKAALNQVE